jgi:hypothetical protein
MDDELDLGACCACGGTENVRNLICLDAKAPVPGTGWGCAVCGLPADGALTVVCDRCLDLKIPHILVIDGLPVNKRRVFKYGLVGTHRHDLSKHHELEQIRSARWN